MKYYNQQEVGKRIKNIRELEGVRQFELAEEMNISREMLSRIENGKNSCAPDQLMFLCQRFNKSVDYFFFGTESEQYKLKTKIEIILEIQKMLGRFSKSLRSKFNMHNENWCNHNSCVNMVRTAVLEHLANGVTGSFHPLSGYQIIMAPALTQADEGDYGRILDYVRNGGQLYLSGGDCHELLEKIFGAKVTGRTEENVVYIAPNEDIEDCFRYFNRKYLLHFDGTAPIVEGIPNDKIVATITLPYTRQNVLKFASIHSNPPGIETNIPAMAVTEYGKGKVFWSALTIEAVENHDYRRITMNLLKKFFDMKKTITSDAPENVEIIGFKDQDCIYVHAVQFNESYRPHCSGDFMVTVSTENAPKRIISLPKEEPVDYEYVDGAVKFKIKDLKCFLAYQIIL